MSRTRDSRAVIFGALAGLLCALMLVGGLVAQPTATAAPTGQVGNSNGPASGPPAGAAGSAIKVGGAPDVADAFAHSVPPAVLTATVGTKFTIDVYINGGTNSVVGQQSYLTFTTSLLQVVNASQPGCVPSTTINPDSTSFPVVLQNAVNNGTGEISFASGTFGAPLSGDFRVATIGFCPQAGGDTTVHWQFSAPARVSKITDASAQEVENPALYVDVPIHIIAPPTATPTVTSTPTATSTPTPSATFVGGGVLANDLQLSSAPGIGSLNATIAGKAFGTGGYVLLNYNNNSSVPCPCPNSPNPNDYSILTAPFAGATASISRGSTLSQRIAGVQSGGSAFIDSGTHYFSGLYDAGPDGSGNTIIINLSGLPTTPFYLTIYTNNNPGNGARNGTLSVFNGINGGAQTVGYAGGQGAVEQWLLSGSSTATIFESNGGATAGNLPVGGILFDLQPVQWTATATPALGSSLAAPGLYFSGGTSQVFVGGANGVKAAFDGGSGAQFWSTNVGGAVFNRGPIVPINGTNVALFTSGDGYVNALRAADGSSYWAGGGHQIGSSAAASPAYGPGQGPGGVDLVFAGTNENSTSNVFVALNATDGSQVWAFNGVLGPVTTNPTVDLANHRVYFGSNNASGSGGGLWALNTQTGALIWGPLGFGPDATGFPTLSDDGTTIYAALGTTPTLYALNTVDGSQKAGWTPFAPGGNFMGAPWLDGGYVYVTAGNSIYALDATTGALKPGWTTPNVPGAGTPLVLSDSHQAIYVGSNNGAFYKLNLSDGSLAHPPLDLGTGGAAVSNPTYDVIRNAFYVTSNGRVISIAGNW
jgi:hypothetical protein